MILVGDHSHEELGDHVVPEISPRLSPCKADHQIARDIIVGRVLPWHMVQALGFHIAPEHESRRVLHPTGCSPKSKQKA